MRQQRRLSICNNARREALDYFVKAEGIHTVRINTPIPDVKVNIYFIKEPVPTLIDAPPEEKLYLDELSAGLGAVGYSLEDIGRIIITHPHFDHFGSARAISDKSGAEIWISQGGARWLEGYETELHNEEMFRSMILKKAGAAASEIKFVTEFYRQANCFARGAKPARYLKRGDTFELASRSFAITEIPGHTPWCILIHDVNNATAFTGDFLVPDISSRPLVQWTDIMSKDYKTLKSYIASLKKVREMNLQIAFPGHGKIIRDPSKRIDDLLSFIDVKRRSILSILKKDRQTPLQIIRELFPDLPREGLFRAVSDVMAHLEMLEEDHLAETIDGTPVYFSAVR